MFFCSIPTIFLSTSRCMFFIIPLTRLFLEIICIKCKQNQQPIRAFQKCIPKNKRGKKKKKYISQRYVFFPKMATTKKSVRINSFLGTRQDQHHEKPVTFSPNKLQFQLKLGLFLVTFCFLLIEQVAMCH